MDEEIAEVAEYPLTLLITFNTAGQFSALLQLIADRVDDGLILFGIRAGTDHKVIGETGNPSQIQHFDVRGFLVLSHADGDFPARLAHFRLGNFHFFNFGISTTFGMRQKPASLRYRTIDIQVILRFAALAALSLTSVFAQLEPTPAPAAPAHELQPDQDDPMVRRAKDNVENVKKLISLGALPQMRLKRAQDELQDALDMSLLKNSLYAKDMLPEQMDQMVAVAQKMVFRRQRSMAEMQELVDAGVISRAEAETMNGDLERAQAELQAAQARANLIQQMAESIKIESRMASLESQAQSHPEWAGKVYMKYPGNGVFTPAELSTLESAYISRFLRPLPISANGETATHRAFGFDHRGRVDVAVNPDQPEGLWLMRYLETKKIPYFAFRMAVPNKATGAHIHVGPESTHLNAATSSD
jgi:hypothetical protein